MCSHELEVCKVPAWHDKQCEQVGEIVLGVGLPVKFRIIIVFFFRLFTVEQICFTFTSIFDNKLFNKQTYDVSCTL